MERQLPLVLEATSDAGTWNALVQSLTDEPGYHEWSWLDLHAAMHGVEIVRLLAIADGRPVGVVPVPRRSPRAVEGLSVPFPYLGPVVPAAMLEGTLRALRTWQRRHHLLIARFDLGPAAPGVDRLPRVDGFTARADSTLIVDASHGSLETLRSGYSSLRRRDIRRAVRDGADVRPSLPGEVSALLPAVLEEAFGAHGGSSPYPRDVGERIERWAAGRPTVGLFTATVDEEPAGVQVVLGGGRFALAWAGASLRRFRAANPNVLLYDRLLQWAVEQGYERIDLGGRVDDGVLRYKLAFGAVEQPYWTAESSIVPRRLLAVGGLARRVLRR